MSPKISVIIPTLNEFSRIGELISCVLADKYVAEVIIADSPKSTDEVSQVADKYGIRYLLCKKGGRAAQMNQGAKEAVSSILYFIHADTLPPKGFGQAIINAVEQNGGTGCFSYTFDKSTFWLDINSRATRKKTIFSGGGDQSFFIKKETFQSIGGFDEEYVLMEDFDMVRRLKERDIPFSVIQKDMKVSARKYEKNSYLWVNLVNGIMFLMFHLRCKPVLLLTWYKRLLRS